MQRQLSRLRPGIVPTMALLTLAGATAVSGQRDSTDRATAVHVLHRVTFGPTASAIEHVMARGAAAYIDEQLRPEGLDDTAVERALGSFATLNLDSRALWREYFGPAQEAQRQRQAAPQGAVSPSASSGPQPQPVQQNAAARQRLVISELTQARLLRAVRSERQLQEVLVDFWFNHFNVFVGKGPVRQYLTEYEREAIRPHVLGSFRSLLGAVARSPAMLFYLDNWLSAAPAPNPTRSTADIERRLADPGLRPEQRQRLTAELARQRPPARGSARGLNENYARELLELHTLGVDGGYTQADVVALARIFTGWTIEAPRQSGAFVFRPALHDQGSKTLLGVDFAPSGQTEGEKALDLLAAHPAAARHIAYKLAQRFVADDPPPALVDRVARVFASTRGDLTAVTRAVLTSPEFMGTEYRRAKVKTPLEFVVSAIRATEASVDNAQPLIAALNTLGMPLYGSQPPTGYSSTADAWVNTGALLARMNFAVDLVAARPLQPVSGQRGGLVRGTPPADGNAGGRGGGRQGLRASPVRVDVSRIAPDASASSRSRVVELVLHGAASEATLATLSRASTGQQLLALTLGSPEFQRR